MTNKMIELKSNNPKNYVIVNIDDNICCVHDNNDGNNYFSNNVIAKCVGLGERSVEIHWGNFKELNNNRKNLSVNLKVLNSKKPVEFKSFDFLTYVTYRSNKEKAVQMRNYIVDALNEKFNKDIGFKQEKSLEQKAMETIKYLENKVWEETKKAFESQKHEDFIHHMDLADKYAMDSQKRRYQLRNELNCSKRLKKECELNLKGLLTESCELQVFLPSNQSTLIDFKISLKEVEKNE